MLFFIGIFAFLLMVTFLVDARLQVNLAAFGTMWTLGCIVAMLTVGVIVCGGSSTILADDEATTPESSSKLCGRPYYEVIDSFKQAGFEDVRANALGDVGFIRHFFVRRGVVTSVCIAGRSDFRAGEIFLRSDAVVVKYHPRR